MTEPTSQSIAATRNPLADFRLWIVGLGTIIVPLDSSINVAFPFITGHFDLPLPDARLLVVTFILTSVCLMLVAGRLGDIWGYRRIFRFGLAISAASLLLDAIAPSYGFLLAARIGQGIGAALTLSCGPALAIGLFPESQRGPAIGAYAMFFAIGMAAGPIIGGWLIETFDWRAVFWFRAPIALAALTLSPLLSTPPARLPNQRFDLTGALLLGAMLALIFAALNLLAANPWLSGSAAVAAAIAIAAFIRHQRTSSAPIINLGHFRSLRFSGLTAGNVLINLAAFSIMLVVPFYLARNVGAGALTAGWILAAYAIGVAGTAWLTGRILGASTEGRRTAAHLMRLSLLIVGSGLWLVSAWDSMVGPWHIAATLGLVGAGLGLYQASFLYVVTGTLPPEERGVAGSLAEVTRSMGNVSAATLLFELFRIRSAAGGFEQGFADTYLTAAIIAFILLGVAVLAALRRARS